MKHKVGVIRIR